MKDKCQSYIACLFVVANILWLDITVAGLRINMLIILIATLAMLFFDVWDRQKKQEPLFAGLSYQDIIIYSIGILALISLIGKVIFDPINYTKEIQIIALVLIYYLLRNRFVISENQIMFFSVFGMITNIMLLWHYLVDSSFDFLIQALLASDMVTGWLVAVITINVAAYCIFSGKWLWHGANAVVGFFILLIQKNIPSLILMGAVFFIIPFIFRPTKQLVKKDMQMFFIYAFMLCNMSLLTGYTKVFDEALALTYDLETSVYLELLLSVFGVFFFNFWDKLEENEEENTKKARLFFKRTSVFLILLMTAFTVVLIKGSSSLLPEMMGRLIAQIRNSIAAQKNLFFIANDNYGICGICLVVYFLYSIFESLKEQRRMKATRSQKLSRLISLVYILQCFLLTQTMATTIIYLVFVIVCVNNTRVAVELPKKEENDEAYNSDTVLQRSADVGDSAQ